MRNDGYAWGEKRRERERWRGVKGREKARIGMYF
jgi:hypothetical protein